MAEKKNEQIAVFRFSIIHEFVGGANLTQDEKRRLLLEKCERKCIIPYSNRSRISELTIYRWIRRYLESGGNIESLYPRARQDQGKPRKLDDEAIGAIVNARRQQLGIPVPLLLTRLKQQNLIPRQTGLTTVYRLLHHYGLMDNTPKPEDRRRFEAEEPNDIWQSDVSCTAPRRLWIRRAARPI